MRPRKVLASVRRRIAECIIYDTLTVVRGKLILPAGRGISISIVLLTSADATVRRKAVGAFLQDIAAYVIRPSVRLVRLVVILTDKSVECVIVVLGEKGAVFADSPRLVVGAGILYNLFKNLSTQEEKLRLRVFSRRRRNCIF